MVKIKSSSFTLIELLVVMAVIIILMGLLLPVLQKGRDSAELTRCCNNYRQIGLGISSYVGDYNMYYPEGTAEYAYPPLGKSMLLADHWPGEFADSFWLNIATDSYIGSISVSTAKDKQTAVSNGVWVCPTIYSEIALLAKGMNDRCGIRTRQGDAGTNYSDFTRPFGYTGTYHSKSESVFAGGPTAAIALFAEPNYFISNNYPTYQNGDPLMPPHLDGFNALFADMHVKYTRVTDWSEQGRNLIWDPSKQ
ncbi:MAG: type II secretion system GspH family protein [Victivallaceae bacterium]|nr:type II secretion system GspH family protein [Victivallaceae bacterium]